MTEQFAEHKRDVAEQLAEYKHEVTEQFAEHKRDVTEQLTEHKHEITEQFVEHKQETGNRFDSLEKRLSNKIESRALKTERMLLNEMERYHEIYTSRMNNIEKDMADIKQYYRIYKMENESVGLLLSVVDDLQNRVERLEVRMA